MARSRRKKHLFEEPTNHDRWLISYADFITLLFAFFVVMYSISSVNNAKYEILSEALEHAFSKQKADGDATHTHPSTLKPIPIGNPPTTIDPIILDNPAQEQSSKERELSEEILKERDRLQHVSEQFEQVLQPYIQENLVEVKKHDFWIELEMNSQLLFSSGEAELSSKALPVIQQVAKVIKSIPNIINIEGHTDDLPIDTVEFPSNWELSAARATSVVRELINHDISPKRIAAVGYGEFHPIADNNNDQGRFKNRRVVLLLMSQAFARYGMSDEQRAKALNIKTTPNNNNALIPNNVTNNTQ